MANVHLTNVNKFYGDTHSVKNINLTIHDQELLVLVGPSGCGKSTLLRMIAGLEEISSGEIFIDNKLINDVPPKDRDIAMVFQNYALYPHMTVFENMSFALKLKKYPKAEIKQRVEEVADILNIRQLLYRKPRQLSGGQRQRVAVGRAIVRNPRVFLFDEPLSNLDAKMRVEMRNELNKLHNRLKATIIYVTHDQSEAMTMGDRIVVMKDGVIQQIAKPIPLYENPHNVFVASFIGTPPSNFLDGLITKNNGDLFFKGLKEHFEIRLQKKMHDPLKNYINKKVIFSIRPEDIYDKLFVTDDPQGSVFKAKVEIIEPMGSEILLYFQVLGSTVVAKVNSNSQVSIDQEIELVIDTNKIHFFDIDSKKAIV